MNPDELANLRIIDKYMDEWGKLSEYMPKTECSYQYASMINSLMESLPEDEDEVEEIIVHKTTKLNLRRD